MFVSVYPLLVMMLFIHDALNQSFPSVELLDKVITTGSPQVTPHLV